MTTPEENTLDPATAKRALEESKASAHRTNAVVDDAQRVFGFVIAHRRKNHYVDSMSAIMRGSH